MRVYRITDPQLFKQKNHQLWSTNAEFWLAAKMVHLRHVGETVRALLQKLLIGPTTLRVIDFGCGEGWIARMLRRDFKTVEYVGLDFNEPMLRALRIRHQDDRFVEFHYADLEAEIPAKLEGTGNIVIAAFSLFEMPQIAAAFANACKLRVANGALIVISLDPILQLLAISERQDEFLENLRDYQEAPEALAYDKDIDIGDEPSGRVYRGILYSTATYAHYAESYGLVMSKYIELKRTTTRVPHIYQIMVFV